MENVGKRLKKLELMAVILEKSHQKNLIKNLIQNLAGH